MFLLDFHANFVHKYSCRLNQNDLKTYLQICNLDHTHTGGSPNVTLTSSGDFTSGFSGCVLSDVRLGPTASMVEPITFNSAISGQSVTECFLLQD